MSGKCARLSIHDLGSTALSIRFAKSWSSSVARIHAAVIPLIQQTGWRTPRLRVHPGAVATRHATLSRAGPRADHNFDRNANLSYALLTEASAVDTLNIPVPCSLLDSVRVVSLALGFLHAASQRWAFMRRSSYLNLSVLYEGRPGRVRMVRETQYRFCMA